MSLNYLDNISIGVVFPIGNRYQSIHRLKEIHLPYIKNLNFFGYENMSAAPKEVIPYYDHNAYLFYNAMIILMDRTPNAEGWIILHDDYWINWKKFQDLDKTKIWMISDKDMDFVMEGKNDVRKIDPWGWWLSQWGYDATKKAFFYLQNPYGKINYPTIDVPFRYRFTDFYYIPNKYRDIIKHNFNMCVKYTVFNEIAVQTCFGVSVPKEDVIKLKGNYCLSSEQIDWKNINYEEQYGVHQIKFYNDTYYNTLKKQGII